MIIKGFKFGMILQLAIGPIFLLILQTAITKGFSQAMIGVSGVTLVDALFISAAILGLGSIIDKNENIKKHMGYIGATILIIFGLSTLVGVFGISFIPSFSLSTEGASNIFMKTVILTLSSPLTIVFWAGVFSAKIIEEKLAQRDLYLFGLGAVISTLLFLTTISMAGNAMSIAIDSSFLGVMNAAVGLFLIGFGIKTYMRHL